MIQFLSRVARSIARVFAPLGSDQIKLGFQPITADVCKYKGSACHVSNWDGR